MRYCPCLLPLVSDNRLRRTGFNAVASVQTLELQQADNLDDLCAELLQQVDSRLKRTAGSDQVIDNDDLVSLN